MANLPITIYPAMKIGQLSFVQMSEPAETPYGSGRLGSKYQGQRGPTPSRYWQNFATVVILVTGASGFVGPPRRRASSSRAASACARSCASARGAAALEGVDCELVRGDVTDPASLRAAARGVRTIVHLVAIIEGSPADFERVMAAGTGNLVEAAREAGVRRIVLMSALGTGPGATRFRTTAPSGRRSRPSRRPASSTPCSGRASSSAPTEARCLASSGSRGWRP